MLDGLCMCTYAASVKYGSYVLITYQYGNCLPDFVRACTVVSYSTKNTTFQTLLLLDAFLNF